MADAKQAQQPKQEPTRQQRIAELEKEVASLNEQETKLRTAIGNDLIQRDAQGAKRGDLNELLAKAHAHLDASQKCTERLDTIKATQEHLAKLKAEATAREGKKREADGKVAARHEDLGRAAYECFRSKVPSSALAVTPLQGEAADAAETPEAKAFREKHQALFAEILATDRDILDKTKKAAELEEKKKKGFFGKVSAGLSGMTLHVPTEQDRAKALKPAGPRVLGSDFAAATGDAKVAKVLEELQPFFAEIKTLDAEIADLRGQEKQTADKLTELQAAAPSMDKRIAMLKEQKAKADADRAALAHPLGTAYVLPKPASEHRNEAVENSLASLDAVCTRREHDKNVIERLRAEIRVAAIEDERKTLKERRQKLVDELKQVDDRVANLNEEHLRLDGVIRQLLTLEGNAPPAPATEEAPVEAAGPPLEAVGPAELEPASLPKLSAAARFAVTAPNGTSTFLLEVFGGAGLTFGRSHLDQKRNMKNDLVLRAPPGTPDADLRTGRISRVHGGLKLDAQGAYVADWSATGMKVDGSPAPKNAWAKLPAQTFTLDVADGAVLMKALPLFAKSGELSGLLLKRPTAEGLWYLIVRDRVVLTWDQNGVLAFEAPTYEGPGVDIALEGPAFTLSVRAGCEALGLAKNGAAATAGSSPLAPGLTLEAKGWKIASEALAAAAG